MKGFRKNINSLLRNSACYLRYSASTSGIATFPTVIALTIVILAIAVGVTTLGLSESFISARESRAARAYVYAESGARDALQRIARDKKYACATADCYSIDYVTSGCSTNDGCARVSVSVATGTIATPKIITSKGRVKDSVRHIQVDVIFDSSLNGEIATSTWQEITN